ncbi:hypothetical protein MTP03_20700 [Tsukamurella sp. PLM1]|nr:hypothetical protein MTP03_20700 [Tsukamurella sp. PLM1]
MTVTVVLADDHAAIRAGLRLLLESSGEVRVIGEAADGAAALRQARALRPDVVVMDVRMPRVDGLAATASVVAETDSAVLVLTTFDLDEYVLGALAAGASGFLLKSAGGDELIRAVRAVAEGDAVLDPKVTRAVIAALPARRRRRPRTCRVSPIASGTCWRGSAAACRTSRSRAAWTSARRR